MSLAEAELVLRFDEVAVPGDAVPGAVNDGSTAAEVTVSTTAGGRLTWADGWEGGGVRTPEFGADERTPAAALVVWPARADALDPGARDFAIGVDFAADEPERGRPGDDGDNLVQRGRFGDVAQVKLQLDHGVPSCRMAGAGGAVLVSAREQVVPHRWYRLTCRRAEGRVVLELLDLEADTAPEVWAEPTDPGEIHFDGVPWSVGAKVSADGVFGAGSSDQFHGVIDRVVVDIW